MKIITIFNDVSV